MSVAVTLLNVKRTALNLVIAIANSAQLIKATELLQDWFSINSWIPEWLWLAVIMRRYSISASCSFIFFGWADVSVANLFM